MKTKLLIIAIAVTACLIVGCSDETEPRKVIIDSDMIQGFDDGVAFTMLLASDDVSVLGLTTVTGNSWAQEGLAYGMRQAEPFVGKNISFIPGSQYPLRPGRLETLSEEVAASPGIEASWQGAVSYPEVGRWDEFYRSTYCSEPRFQTSTEDASEFIARQINANPGEVTILAIGPCTNIARAILRHPEIAAATKEIIYMGGAVFCDGNTTPYAELNFLYDPEAAKVCLRAPFPRQTLVSLDVCNTVEMDKDIFFGMDSVIVNPVLKDVYHRQHLYGMFSSNPDMKIPIWDVISTAILLCPDVVTESRKVRLDVDDSPSSPTYGQSYVTSDPNCRIVRVPVGVDAQRIFDMVRNAYSKVE